MAKSSEHDGNTNPIGTKGYTGNPGGRPKMPEELKKAFQDASPSALQTLIDVMHNGERGSERVKAAEVILDRAWGKAAQTINGDINTGLRVIDTSKLPKEQVDAIAMLAIAGMDLESTAQDDDES